MEKCVIPTGAGRLLGTNRATCSIRAGSTSASSSFGIRCRRANVQTSAARHPSLSASQGLISSIHSCSKKGVLGARRANGKQRRIQAVLEQTRPGESDNKIVFPPTPIWLSDVVGRQQRPYFLNRVWTKKDVSYASYMVAVHALCLLAPFTFSWDAFGCFGIMYIITGKVHATTELRPYREHRVAESNMEALLSQASAGSGSIAV